MQEYDLHTKMKEMLEQYIPVQLSKDEFQTQVATLFPNPEVMAIISALTNALVMIQSQLDIKDERIFILKIHTVSALAKLVASLDESHQKQTIHELANIGLPFLKGAETKPEGMTMQ